MITVGREVLVHAKRGNQQSIADVLEACRPDVVIYIKKIRCSQEELSDLVQDAMIVILTCIERYDEKQGEFGALVNDAVHKLLSSYLRDRKREVSLDSWGEPHSNYAERNVDLEDAIDHLTPTQRVLVREHFGIGERVFDYSTSQLAARHNLTSEQVHRELQEAFRSLRESY